MKLHTAHQLVRTTTTNTASAAVTTGDDIFKCLENIFGAISLFCFPRHSAIDSSVEFYVKVFFFVKTHTHTNTLMPLLW